MDVKVKVEKPPIYEEVIKVFEINPESTLFTYGDTIYAPGGGDIPDHLIIHEQVHMKQQNYNDADAAIWWENFLKDKEFRLTQEAEAYAAQYAFICKTVKNHEERFKIRMDLAKFLSGAMYGFMINQVEGAGLINRLANVN